MVDGGLVRRSWRRTFVRVQAGNRRMASSVVLGRRTRTYGGDSLDRDAHRVKRDVTDLMLALAFKRREVCYRRGGQYNRSPG